MDKKRFTLYVQVIHAVAKWSRWVKILGDEWQVYSGGIEAHGVNPKAIEAMKEVGIDISNHTSNLIDKNILNQSDLVVTLCSDLDNNCPILPPNVKRTLGI